MLMVQVDLTSAVVVMGSIRQLLPSASASVSNFSTITAQVSTENIVVGN